MLDTSIRQALSERRFLSKEERREFKEPKAAPTSLKNMLHWIVGTTVQDQPALLVMAIASIGYSAFLGARHLWVLIIG